MPAAPTFDQIAPRLYGASAAATPWIGYYAGAPAGLGAQATWDAVWADVGGVLLVLGAAPADPADFATAFGTALPALSPTGLLRVAWIDRPDDGWTAWSIGRLDALATGSGPSTVWTIARQARFGLGAYALRIDPGGVLTRSDPDGLGPGIALPDGATVLEAPGGSYPAVAGSAGIPIAGAGVGAIAARLALTGTDGDDLAALRVLIRYASARPDRPTAEVVAVDMPILSQGGAALVGGLRFDPLAPYDPDRSHIALAGPGMGSPPPLASTLRTTLGYVVSLRPTTAPAPLWAGRLAFARTPLSTVAGGEPAMDTTLTPDGAFAVTVAAGGSSSDVMLGLSGLEHVARPATGALALFVAGQPAFAPHLDVTAEDAAAPGLTDLATTAWMTLLPATATAAGLTYTAQPRQAPLFHAGTTVGDAFLELLELPAATLAWPTHDEPLAPMPVGAFTGLDDPDAIALARRMEDAVLAPTRRTVLGVPAAPEELGAEAVDPARTAVTPNGLVVEVAPDGRGLTGVLLANMPGTRYPDVKLTAVGPALQAALQSNQLFFVVSNVDTFMGSTSVPYQLTRDDLPALVARGVPQTVVDAIGTALENVPPPVGPFGVFPTEGAFDTVVAPLAGSYLPVCHDVAGRLRADVEGWSFQLSPRSWRTAPDSPTLMVAKFGSRSLVELAADPTSWGWPAAATGTHGVAATQAVLQGVIDRAAAAPAGTPLRAFFDQVANTPAWNGVLFLNAPVGISELPHDLQFMVAGIDTDRFYAHHVGFSLTPFTVTDGNPALGQTAAFGLISYHDEVDLTSETTVPFAFKTKALDARFANAHLTGFSAQVELLTNRLFGSLLTKQETEHGNNLILDGSYQRVGGVPSYLFALAGANVFQVGAGALASIEILGVALATRTAATATTQLRTDFTLQGNLRFAQSLPFDPFSYGIAPAPLADDVVDGRLRFSGLTVTLAADVAHPRQQTFTVDEAHLSFDLRSSVARPRSLVAGFPLTLNGLVAQGGDDGGARTPEDLGFASISVPVQQTPMTAPWYGLTFVLDLGTLGALAGSVGLTVDLLVAWAPGTATEPMPVYVGLRLPDARSLGIDWPLQGVMSLGFRSFQLSTYATKDGETAYLLRLRRFALRVLGMSVPPGNVDVVLFGNPDQSTAERLGWYAAYAQDAKDAPAAARRPAPARVDRRLRSGRRAPALPEEAGR